jgi:3-oxoadipate enol-lactonase
MNPGATLSAAAAFAALPAQEFRQDGRTIRYLDQGSGPALLLVHAFGEDGTLWLPQVHALGARWRVIAPDLRGSGGSGSTDGAAVDMDTYADDLLALLDHLGLRRVALGGISLGGYVALSFVLRHPQRVAALVLANTRAGADSDEGRVQRGLLAQAVEQIGPRAVNDGVGDKPYGPHCPPEAKAFARAITLRQDPRGLTSAIRGMAQRPDRLPALPSIAVPTLVISGTHDVLIPSTEGQAMHRLIPGSRFVDIPGAGHLSNIDQPLAFNQALETFLARLPAAAFV